jgi:hypothetical protein
MRRIGRSIRAEHIAAKTSEVFLDAPENHSTRQRKASRYWSDTRVVDQTGQSRNDQCRWHTGAAFRPDETPDRATEGGFVDRRMVQDERNGGPELFGIGEILRAAEENGVSRFVCVHLAPCNSTSG